MKDVLILLIKMGVVQFKNIESEVIFSSEHCDIMSNPFIIKYMDDEFDLNEVEIVSVDVKSLKEKFDKLSFIMDKYESDTDNNIEIKSLTNIISLMLLKNLSSCSDDIDRLSKITDFIGSDLKISNVLN